MQDPKVSLTQQMAAWAKGEYALYPHCNDFFDWFCSESSLERKAKGLKSQVTKFVAAIQGQGVPLDTDRVYVFFKNNCPMNGPLYDSFSICDLESGDVLYWVTGKSGHSGKAEYFSRASGFNVPVREAATFTELLKH